MIMLCYCKKCGRLVQEEYDNEKKTCDYCNNLLEYVPEKFLLEKIALKDDLREQFIDEYIKSSPEFDQYLFEHRDQDLFNRRRETQAKLKHGKAILEGRDKGNPSGIECPYCHSANVKKISTTSRIISTWLVGLASKKIGKQWHCNQCGSDF